MDSAWPFLWELTVLAVTISTTEAVSEHSFILCEFFFNEITPSLHLLITSRKFCLKRWLLNVRCSEMTERISARPWNKEVSEFSIPSSCIWHVKDCTGFNSFLVDVAALFLQPRVFIWAPLLPPRSQPLLLPSRDRGAAATFPPAEPAFLAVRLRLLNYYL